MKFLVNLARILVGALFIFSGLIKANDPMGFGFKLEEYFEVFGTHFMVPLSMGLSILICVFEVWLGILLLLGKWRKFTLNLLLAMIVFFTFLTFYSAYFEKVTDCGCFGDAIPLTPWESFTKDVILLALILLLYFNKQYIRPIASNTLANRITVIGTLLSLLFPLYNYRYLPVMDFRPYKIGNDLVEEMKGVPPVKEIVFIYEKDGQKYEFNENQLMEVDLSQYTYVDRKENIIEEGVEPPVHDFIFSDHGGRDVTDSFLTMDGNKLLTIQYDLAKTDKDLQDNLKSLAEGLEEKGVPTFHLTAGSRAAIEDMEPQLPYLTADKTMLKTVVRSNPGLVLFDGTKILMKWPSTRFPSVEEVMEYTK